MRIVQNINGDGSQASQIPNPDTVPKCLGHFTHPTQYRGIEVGHMGTPRFKTNNKVKYNISTGKIQKTEQSAYVFPVWTGKMLYLLCE